MKIAIAGYGVEGEANYRYWSTRFPEADITIIDQKAVPDRPLPEGVKALLGPDVFSQLQGFDLVIRTAGLSPYKIQTDGTVWSATNEFMERCPAPIIGVTGTKGKGTTASLIASILKKAGRTVWLVGNIGYPGLEHIEDITADDIVVYEMSSFQLWDATRSPHTAVVLYMEQEHLDVHPSMEDYIAAKGKITLHQSPDDLLVYCNGNTFVQQIADSSPARKVAYPHPDTAHVKDGFFWYGEQQLCSIGTLQLKGQHNLDNTVAAIDAIWQYTQDATAITEGIADFKGLPHRLQIVGTFDSITYVDDSIATTPASAIAAVRSFDGHKVLIVGGSSKGSDFAPLASEVLNSDVDVVLIGTEAPHIKALFDDAGFSRYTNLGLTTMPEAVAAARQFAKAGSTIILSPAAASFDMFKNYADRGDQFIAVVTTPVY